ncbi:alpha-L-glutamate ligase [Halobacillus litoralis]|uniref:ATP-grasp domain-containing protein n=1 Tax=Halobacillus litoralis TaxID=45668 RepID=UPI001CD550A2|nr:alpha-L-glutamate ligase [Halobacillus litoralis]MCA0972007.1 alpha-L-glutamate ligase [Halobacillus litoralis]
MSKIYVIHENNEWTDHLTKRLDELALPYELWHLDTGQLDLMSEPPEGIFYNRISASSHTRDHRFAPEYTEAVLAWLERHNRKIINGPRALRLEVSKVNQYMALQKAGIQTPDTMAAVGKEEIVSAADRLGHASFITKHNRAGKGQGVQMFHSKEALKGHLESGDFEEPVDGITLLQQYIQAPEPYIIRHEFINGTFLYGVKVDTSEGFELCPADACSIEDQFCPTDAPDKPKFEILSDYRPGFIDTYEQFLQQNDVDVAAIETIQDASGNVYAYDVNTNTNYNSDAEAVADVYGMLELAKYLKKELENNKKS